MLGGGRADGPGEGGGVKIICSVGTSYSMLVSNSSFVCTTLRPGGG